MTMISEEEKGEVQGESIAGSGQQSKGWGMWGFIRGADPDGQAHVRRSFSPGSCDLALCLRQTFNYCDDILQEQPDNTRDDGIHDLSTSISEDRAMLSFVLPSPSIRKSGKGGPGYRIRHMTVLPRESLRVSIV